MKKYKCLTQQEFLNGEYKLVPIRHVDRFEIMKWRNEQIYHLRQKEVLTAEQQDAYFENVVAKLFDQEQPNQVLFSFLKNKELLGYGGLVHINWADKNAEISFVMNTIFEKDYFSEYWQAYLVLIEKVAFNEIGLHKIFTYALNLRPLLYGVLETVCYKREGYFKDHCFFNGSYVDVIIHSKFSSE